MATKPLFKVQKLVKVRGRTAAGQIDKRVGAMWETIATGSNKTVAERAMKHAQIDNPNSQIRIVESETAA